MSNNNQKRSEDSYIYHNILPAFADYGYPQAGDEKNLKIKGDISIRVGSKTYEPDVVFYAEGVPILLVESKRPKKNKDQTKEEAFSYLKNFPIEKYSRDRIRPKYLAVTIGRSIQVYRYHYELDERGELIEELRPLSRVPTYEELKREYPITPEIKSKLTAETFKNVFYELLSALDKEENKEISVKLVLRTVKLIFNFLKHKENYVSQHPYIDLNGHPDRQQWVRNIFSQYEWEGALGEEVANQFRREILRSFQGANLNQYITPQKVISFMVNLVELKKDDRVLDFECGSGGFLAAAVSQNIPMENVLGIDIADLPYYVAKTYLALYFNKTGEEIDQIPVERNNGLYDWGDSWDVVLSNPAGGSEYDKKNELNDLDKVYANLNKEIMGKDLGDTPSEYALSIQQAINSAKVGGKICLILPEGFFANSSDDFLRKFAARYCKVKAVISLPRGVFRKGTTTRSVSSGSQRRYQKMSILYIQKIRKLEDASTPDLDLKKLNYPVFLASIKKPGSFDSNPDKWPDEIFHSVLREWKKWQEEGTLTENEDTLELKTKDEGEDEKKKPWKKKKLHQEQLIKDKGPLFQKEEKAKEKSKPETRKDTIIPEDLDDLFE